LLVAGGFFFIKVGLDGMVLLIILKLVLWSKVTQTFDLDYGDTFSSVAKMVSISLFVAMTTLQQ